MEITSLISGFLAGVIIAYIVFYLFNKSKTVLKKHFDHITEAYNESVIKSTTLDAQLKNGEIKIGELSLQLAKERASNAKQQNEINIHLQKIAEITANNRFLNEKLTTQKTEVEELQKTAHLQFEKIANKLFEEKSSKFTETNKSNLETLLSPLKEDINKFKTKVEETYDKESKQRFSLEERIKDLFEHTNKISAEANNLAAALKGKPQKRGYWGEMILERILEESGLTKDREYFIQQSIKDEEGNIIRPDVMIKMPDERTIIIDSKVSLNAYDKYVAAEDAEEQKVFLAEHLKATREHINQLSSKQYDNIHNTLDCTMMFMPIEPAFLLAIQSGEDLWYYAYSKRILMVSPTTLIAVLKLFSDLWRREWQNKNALQIVKAGEALYDKFVGFTQTFEEIGKSISTSQDKYDKALGQLNTGRGNLVMQADRLHKLGLKSDKKISPYLLTSGIDDTEIENEEEL